MAGNNWLPVTYCGENKEGSQAPSPRSLYLSDNFGCLLFFWQLQLLIHQVACTQVAPRIHSSWADIAGTGWKDLLKISNELDDNFGRIWSQLKQDLATIWKGFGDNFERGGWQFWRNLVRIQTEFGDNLTRIYWQFWKDLVTILEIFGHSS